ncbi:DUF1275 domain protein [Xylaria bambusicola]|uniref:DUF1275 domain protein n=1 Tax=Xylaria bambusicola TaxID=326684 RepID=UPI002008C8A4|nr:DUF1275 domain protein [Xylaria bambusicola]KAI0525939.1 DUF1275 domain protein [Xylaria bambusicola]
MLDEEKGAKPMSGNDSSSTDQLNELEPKRSFLSRFSEDLDPRFVWAPLLVCCFATGLTDGTLYNAYGTFVSMQTGNTVFVALGTSGQNNRPYGWARSLTSIGSFIIGCVSFSRFHALIGRGRQRRTVVLSFLIQTVFVALAAGIIQGGLIDGRYPSRRDPNDVDFAELAPIALLSFQAAGQIVNSRGLGVAEVPTVVITTLLCDLVSDPNIFAPFAQNPKRNKRAVAFTLTLVGAIAGGFISKVTGLVQNSLWLVAALKLSITIFWVFYSKEKKA